MKNKLSGRFWCALVLFSLIGQVAWVVENMYLNVFMYNMFHATAQDISMMVALSAVSAALTTVFIGALADKIGKRKLFICGGYILWGISIFCFTLLRTNILNKLFPMAISAATLGVLLTITLDCVMTFFGSTANDAAFNAWITDCTDTSNRGAVEGINAMMPLVAILVVFGSFMFFDLAKASSWTIIFSLIGIVVILIGILGIFLIKEPAIKPSETGYFQNIFHGFRLSTVRNNTTLYLILAGFAIFNISIQIFMPYLIIYYEKTLKMSNYVIIMAPAIVLASVCTAIWGKVYDKKGFKFSIAFSLLWLCAGYIVLFFTTSVVPVFIGSLLMMCGYLSGMAVFGAAIRDYTPAGKAGMFQGLRIFSQVLIPGVIGPAIGALVLKNAQLITNNDGTTSFLPNKYIFAAALLAAIVLVPMIFLIISKLKPALRSLKTPFEAELDDTYIPWQEYPRPQMRRSSYMCLNGKWDFSILRRNKVIYDGQILVPFPIESRLSGVEKQLTRKDIALYARKITIDDSFYTAADSERLLLHFGAVDQEASVFINNKEVGSHTGGYLPFTFDITDYIVYGENTVTLHVKDPLLSELPYGKQRRKRGGMWYTPVSGIWQTVWLEAVCKDYISDIRIQPLTDGNKPGVEIEVTGGAHDKTLILAPDGRKIPFTGNKVTVIPEETHLWSAENPYLYEFDIIAGEDKISSYFALRTVSIDGNKILINNQPVFFHGLLDQGYFSDGIYLSATPEGFKNDILSMKELGFNCLRKHIKIEPQLFYYYCDKYGMYVFQDFVNSGKYNFIIDTALPTIGVRRGISHKASAYRRKQFEETALDTVKHLYNHPCVCYYTIFNEGWGQYDADRMYDLFKSVDSSRIWDTTSGWFKETKSDVDSEHIYFKPLHFKTETEKPLVLSEFGGYSLKIPENSFNPNNTYGYKFFTDKAAFCESLEKLYLDEVISAIREHGLCAAILTQVSDVEDETNGLLTYDRQVLKVDKDKMREVARQLQEAYGGCR